MTKTFIKRKTLNALAIRAYNIKIRNANKKFGYKRFKEYPSSLNIMRHRKVIDNYVKIPFKMAKIFNGCKENMFYVHKKLYYKWLNEIKKCRSTMFHILYDDDNDCVRMGAGCGYIKGSQIFEDFCTFVEKLNK